MHGCCPPPDRVIAGPGIYAAGTECRGDGGRRRGGDAAAVQSADVLSRWSFRLGVVAALYVASSIILPVVLAASWRACITPRPLGHPVGYGALVALVGVLSVPYAFWSQRLPESIPRLEAHLVILKGLIQALGHPEDRAGRGSFRTEGFQH